MAEAATRKNSTETFDLSELKRISDDSSDGNYVRYHSHGDEQNISSSQQSNQSEDHQDNPEKDRKLVDSVSQGPKESTQHHIVDWGAGKPDFQGFYKLNAQSNFRTLAMIG